MKTSKVEREKKLLEMRKKVRAKRRLYSSGDESDDSQEPGSGGDDVDIDGDLEDFVVSDNVVEMEEEESEDEESEDDCCYKPHSQVVGGVEFITTEGELYNPIWV